VHEGDLIEALGRAATSPSTRRCAGSAVLIGAGVGITPMVSFARHLVAEGFRLRRTRPHAPDPGGAREGQMRAFGAELRGAGARAGGALKLHMVCRTTAHRGTCPARSRIDTAEVHPADSTTTSSSSAARPASCRRCTTACATWACATQRIQAEAFGPASLKRRMTRWRGRPAPPQPPATEATVSFHAQRRHRESGHPRTAALLEFAEGKGLSPPYACRAGHCGSCLTPLRAGRVTYAEPTAWKPGEGEVLLCCARPAAGGDERIELDL
jgi:ferredoxin